MAFAAIPARVEAHDYCTISVFTTGRVIRVDLVNSGCYSGDTTHLACYCYIRRCGNYSQCNDKPRRMLTGSLNHSTTTVRRLQHRRSEALQHTVLALCRLHRSAGPPGNRITITCTVKYNACITSCDHPWTLPARNHWRRPLKACCPSAPYLS